MLSCIELGTFVNWLDHFFAAIGVAAPIDERDFPRDQSIPRVQRIRWLRGQHPQQPADNATAFQRLDTRRQSVASSAGSDRSVAGSIASPAAIAFGPGHHQQPIQEEADGAPTIGPSRTGHPVMGRLSTSSYPNEAVDPDTGKWAPRNAWTSRHDHLYAKLCFSVLLFKSPRKSNYIIAKGKQWYVDWASGRMVRVLPPTYGEIDSFGPWQVIMPENRLI